MGPVLLQSALTSLQTAARQPRPHLIFFHRSRLSSNLNNQPKWLAHFACFWRCDGARKVVSSMQKAPKRPPQRRQGTASSAVPRKVGSTTKGRTASAPPRTGTRKKSAQVGDGEKSCAEPPNERRASAHTLVSPAPGQYQWLQHLFQALASSSHLVRLVAGGRQPYFRCKVAAASIPKLQWEAATLVVKRGRAACILAGHGVWGNSINPECCQGVRSECEE